METHAKPHGIIKRSQVRLDESDGRVRTRPNASGPARCAEAARVRLLDLDEHTQAFEFTCSCGEVSLIEIRHDKKS